MPTASTVRRITPAKQRNFGRIYDVFPVPDLTEIQTRSYERFLQADLLPEERADSGLEGVFREIFPIKSYDSTLTLEYIKFDLGKPRYEQDECRELRLTYGRPLHVWLRLNKGETAIEESVYLGDMPIMIGGGEFIINGAERVVVSQLHRSPGVDFVVEIEASDRKLHACRVIPERGSWIELQVTKKDTLGVRIDQSGKFSSMTLLRAMSPQFSSDDAILKAFYDSETILTSDPKAATLLEGKIACGDVVDPTTGEVLIESGTTISKTSAQVLADGDIGPILVLKEAKDPLILQSLQEDPTTDHESALLRIYQRLRPGNPPQLEKARELFHEKFFDTNRYRLGKVGRFRINRKFNQSIPDDQMTLDPEDYVNAIRYILNLRKGKGHVDDIDHLGNRRLRTIDELAADELRKGFLKLRRTVQERMSLKDAEDMTPRSLINPKSISAAIEYFFGRGELSQVVDQTNPLAQLTHERRLSALGPGGLNRKRAGFEVRDVHISHYGRICPIETPEGTNIGLISSLGIYGGVDEYGFLVTPYREIKNAHRTENVVWMRADEESEAYLAPADADMDDAGKLTGPLVIARYQTDFHSIPIEQVQYMDISPKQMVGVSAGLIPFLEHDDANRALMGSNMQRQAVPLLIAEPPIVATGLEKAVAMNSGMIVKAPQDATVTYVDSSRIVLDNNITFKLRKYVGLNERTCLNQKPVVDVGQKVKKGDLLADGASTFHGELALGRNVLVGFMAWDGYNFEDAIIISEKLVKQDVYTSIHIEEFEIEIRETKLGREEFTRDIPNVSEKALRNLDENGIVRIGTYVKPGDILVGKVAPKSKSELTPEEKLLHAIFGRAGEDVKNDSLEVPSGVEGIVIKTNRFSRRMSLNEDERKAFEKELKDTEAAENVKIAEEYRQLIKALEEAVGGPVLDPTTNKPLGREKDPKILSEESERFRLEALDLRSPDKAEAARKVVRMHGPRGRGPPRREGPQAEQPEARRRAALGRASDGQDLHRDQAGHLRRRQDGRPARQQGRHRQDPAGRGHAVPHRRHLDRDPVEPARRAEPYERRPDLGDPPWLGRREHRHPLPGGLPRLRRRERNDDPRVPRHRRPSRERQGPALRRPHRRSLRPARDRRLYLHAQAPPPRRRQDPRPRHRPVQPHHPATPGRQGPLRRPAFRRDGSVGVGSLRRGVYLAGTPHRQVRRRRGPHQDLREHGERREHPRSRHPRQLRRPHQRNPRPRAQHAA